MTAIIKIFQMEVPMLWSSQQIPRFARLIAASIWALTIPVLSLLPAPFFQQAHELVHFPQANKVVHAIMYAILTALLLWSNARPDRKLQVRSACFMATAASAYGLLMEWLQHFTATRHMCLWDGLANATGAFLVVGIALGISKSSHGYKRTI